MIDIHNHLLINVDDGAQTDQEAIQLIQQAQEEGITGIIVTPHYSKRYSNFFDQVELKIIELCNLREVEKSNIKIYPGQEIRISGDLLEDIDNENVKGLNYSKYLLIEFPPNEVPHYTKKLFFDLQNKGYIPIIAHPERNLAIMQDMNLLYELVSAGALSQVTSSSLGGYFGKNIQKASIKMIEHHLVHFIASDAHHVGYRPFIMQSLFEEKKLKPLHHDMKRLISNAEAVIDNQPVTKEPPLPPKEKKGFKRFSFLK
ncbi:tyrosine-protein phosphatase [Staphylococcus debuckii]|uniref:tyrosine-protein phosphatase n=1 Tax=Staphylococcus debuckii TaxID=2044912 RepID=UPI000F43309D|nr:CpsB/CapC family capsule biosynthesis tyrosine phosphatase [Staphylococcus debuckii]AYU55002.1 capsular biosynthesis protein [Staphylococcus debuckii]